MITRKGNLCWLLAMLTQLAVMSALPVNAQSFLPGGGSVEEQPVKARLIAAGDGIAPGRPVQVGLLLDIEDKWHVYWRNPGGPGLPVGVEWQLPEGWKAEAIDWPRPQRFDYPPFVNFGYEKRVLLPIVLHPPNDLKTGTKVELRGKASWLACKEACIPGEADVSVTLPVKESTADVEANAAMFDAAFAELPKALPGYTFEMKPSDGGARLIVTGPIETGRDYGDIYFYPHRGEQIDPTAKQKATIEDGKLTLELTKAEEAKQLTLPLGGVLVAANGWSGEAAAKALRVYFGDKERPSVAGAGDDAIAPPARTGGDVTFIGAIVAGFIGGLILNLMPCVFPVLSLKVLGFVKQAGEDRAKIRMHGYVFGLGVLVSFWILAGVLLVLRAAALAQGAEAGPGWGFQLQEPSFVLAMSFLLLAIGLNLAGVFDLGFAVSQWAGQAEASASSGGYGGSFLSGVLATVIATPCAAPFMGTGIGYALGATPTEAMIVFTVLGIGMALPYVILSHAPQLIERLPRPGRWMESFKQALAFPMLATVLWLVWVYAGLTDDTGALWLGLGLLLFAMGLWVYGRWGLPTAGGRSRSIAVALLLVLAVAGGWLSMQGAGAAEPGWDERFDAEVAEARLEGRPVFVDFTARWCLICQSNKLTLHSEAVKSSFDRYNVKFIEADWTKRGPGIAKVLARFQRQSVPLYVVYPADPKAEPIVLPNTLTPGIVTDAIEKASNGAK